MKQNTNVNNLTNVLAWFAIIITMLIIGKSLSLRTYMDDDVYFVNALKGSSLLGFLEMRYMTWSGRVIIEAIMVKTINHEYVWRFIMPVCLFILCHSICKISSTKKNPSPILTLLMMLIFFLMPQKTYNEGAFWITGFYNYLLPISLGFYAISVINKTDESSSIEKLLSLLSLPVACSNEQMGITIVIYLVISLAITRNVKPYNATFALIALLSFSFLMLAPGNKIRLLGESRRIPEFYDFGLLDKIGLGIDRFSSMINSNSYLLLLLSILLVALYLLENHSHLNKFGVCSISIIIAFQITKELGLIPNQFMGNGDWSDWVFYTRYSASLIFYVSLIYLATHILNEKKLPHRSCSNYFRASNCHYDWILSYSVCFCRQGSFYV
ncbi:DUF6056 family protein [Enterobacter cloacae]|nr:hypothetical protein [Enterobacter cloacae]